MTDLTQSKPLRESPESAEAPYAVEHDQGIVQLRDIRGEVAASVAPGVGNMTFALAVHGHEILRFPFRSIDEFLEQGSGLQGIPFLGPWANRLDEPAFYADGQRYAFDMDLGNVRGAVPIHGFLSTAPGWQVIDVGADERSAWVTSALPFYANPLWMKQFPFAHTIRMTHRLASGTLEVETRIENMANVPMPVSIGFHPYFRLTDSPRDEWTVSVRARSVWELDASKLPTGAQSPIERLFPNPTEIPLRDLDLDHVFGDLVSDSDGRSLMRVRGTTQQIDVFTGPRYRAAVVYAPKHPLSQDPNFICLEPMAAITNAMNLAHRGLYADLQRIPPGGTWQERFWIHPSGFSKDMSRATVREVSL